jgi:hypothetical protein
MLEKEFDDILQTVMGDPLVARWQLRWWVRVSKNSG